MIAPVHVHAMKDGQELPVTRAVIAPVKHVPKIIQIYA